MPIIILDIPICRALDIIINELGELLLKITLMAF